MGAWSADPFGNDSAADWAWELDDATDWTSVQELLTSVLDKNPEDIDDDTSTLVIAAAEAVAHGLGRPTQSDTYTESVQAFVKRVPAPTADLITTAAQALDVAASPRGDLAELWADSDSGQEWEAVVAQVRAALSHR
ncbi:DUF4259 domain-containing protein [Microbacterium kyungheense]|jgi:hypothetical protein|uniref:Uncharacterized protein DUF4259 n=1 Tax=Microbacterium kyungheense TaxID=1263636 RepID=A0A543EU38_9MICO|nr:DUF4259 domain-containing protein [Microbacterium kyungheense]TQM25091.1 uncharacterized protein DUF4259 [Microbacterium kyungheense]